MTASAFIIMARKTSPIGQLSVSKMGQQLLTKPSKAQVSIIASITLPKTHYATQTLATSKTARIRTSWLQFLMLSNPHINNTKSRIGMEHNLTLIAM